MIAGHVLDDEVERDSDHEPADDRSCRALEAAEDCGGEGVDENRLHERRVEEELRRLGHQAGDGAEHRGEAPADREHPVDADADERRLRRAAARPRASPRPSFVKRKSAQTSTTETRTTTNIPG